MPPIEKDEKPRVSINLNVAKPIHHLSNILPFPLHVRRSHGVVSVDFHSRVMLSATLVARTPAVNSCHQGSGAEQ